MSVGVVALGREVERDFALDAGDLQHADGARRAGGVALASRRSSRNVMSGCSSTFSALCMFLSRPSFGDVSVAAGIAISNASTAPGFSALSQKSAPAAAGASCARVTRTVVVDAV